MLRGWVRPARGHLFASGRLHQRKGPRWQLASAATSGTGGESASTNSSGSPETLGEMALRGTFDSDAFNGPRKSHRQIFSWFLFECQVIAQSSPSFQTETLIISP